MRSPLYVAILLGAALAAGADGPDSDKSRIQGSWKVVSIELYGEPQNDNVGGTFKFAHGKVTLIDKDNPSEASEFVVALFPDEEPKQIDFRYTSPVRNDITPGEETLRGIYRIEGHKLVLCMCAGKEARPTKFSTLKGAERWLVHLERLDQK